MTTEKEDTDPSTPEARRPNSSRRGYGLRALGARDPVPEDPNRPTTDPGLGPGRPSTPTPVPPSARSRGVVVPPPSGLGPNAVTPPAGMRVAPSAPAAKAAYPALSRAKESKDSVELLLDGMAGPSPERRKTTPQSDGEASASYHARHGVYPGHALAEPGPKVVVERAAEPLSDPDTVPTPPPPAANAADTTVVPPRALSRRIAMAVLAALLIVLAAFILMDLGSSRPQSAARAPAPSDSGEAPSVSNANVIHPSQATAAVSEPFAVATSTGAPATAPSEAEIQKPAGAIQADGVKRRRRGSGENDDVGEFKTSF
jgi:hypothetical protein